MLVAANASARWKGIDYSLRWTGLFPRMLAGAGPACVQASGLTNLCYPTIAGSGLRGVSGWGVAINVLLHASPCVGYASPGLEALRS
jgi:hypothetical protein